MKKIKDVTGYRFLGIFSVFFFLWQSLSLSAENAVPMILEGGVKSGYSAGLLEPYWYHRLFLKGGYRWDRFNFTAGYSRYFQYQVSDINGDVQFIDINRISGEAEVNPGKKIALSGMLAGWFGQQEYRRLEGLGSIIYEGKDWSFTLEGGGSSGTYMFNLTRQNFFNIDLYFEAARFLTDNFSVDGSYSLIYTGMEGAENIHKHLFRGGISLIPLRYAYFFSGATVSLDSDNFLNLGLDIGGSIYIFRYVKLTGTYLLSYGSSFTSDDNASFPGPSSGGAADTEKYFSHRILLGASLKYR